MSIPNAYQTIISAIPPITCEKTSQPSESGHRWYTGPLNHMLGFKEDVHGFWDRPDFRELFEHCTHIPIFAWRPVFGIERPEMQEMVTSLNDTEKAFERDILFPVQQVIDNLAFSASLFPHKFTAYQNLHIRIRVHAENSDGSFGRLGVLQAAEPKRILDGEPLIIAYHTLDNQEKLPSTFSLENALKDPVSDKWGSLKCILGPIASNMMRNKLHFGLVAIENEVIFLIMTTVFDPIADKYLPMLKFSNVVHRTDTIGTDETFGETTVTVRLALLGLVMIAVEHQNSGYFGHFDYNSWDYIAWSKCGADLD